LLALVDQLRDEFAHTLIAPAKDRGTVIDPDVGVIHHVLEVAIELGCIGCRQVRAAGRRQRLLHM
jgi:hypothetical protein